MKLLTKEIEKKLIKQHEGDITVQAKFFDPQSQWTWFAISYDPNTKTFFGLVKGLEIEYGYFSLDELKNYKGKFGLGIERDMYFVPKPVSEVEKELN